MVVIDEKPEGAALDAYEIVLHAELYHHIVNIIKQTGIFTELDNDFQTTVLYHGKIPDTPIEIICRLFAGFNMIISTIKEYHMTDCYVFEWHEKTMKQVPCDELKDLISRIDSITDSWYAAFEAGEYEKCTEIIKNDGGDVYVIRRCDSESL